MPRLTFPNALRAGRPARRGFTLMEIALASIIIGLGVFATMQLFYVSTQQNRFGTQMTTAILLANNIQETMANLSFNDPITRSTTFGAEGGESLSTYNDVDDFNGSTFGNCMSNLASAATAYPIDALRQPILTLPQYAQVVTVTPVYPNRPGTTVGTTAYSGAVRITVKILYTASTGSPPAEVYSYSWMRVDG